MIEASKLGPWLTALLLGGLGLTAYGLSDFWSSMTVWPDELRWDLRHALRENAKGEKAQAEYYLGQAWSRARDMDLENLGHDAYLKTTGIAITLAEIYESEGKQLEAYHVLIDALQHLQQVSPLPKADAKMQRIDMEATPTTGDVVSQTTSASLKSSLSQQERMRAVALSHKLSELAEALKRPKDEQEEWLVYSVETILKHVMGRSGVSELVVRETDPRAGKTLEESAAIFEELELPQWIVHHDLAAPFEALASFYSRGGKISYAMPLYLQAISILIPPSPQVSSADDQCRAAELMGNISELIVRTSTPRDSPNPPPESLRQAESWASKAAKVADRARKASFGANTVCEMAYAFALFNLGTIKEMSGDEVQAKLLFTQSLDRSTASGFEDGTVNARAALKNVGKKGFGVAPGRTSSDMGDASPGS